MTRYATVAVSLLGILLAACSSVVVVDDRASRPLPAKLVAHMSSMGLSPADPIFVRIFKQESELEVWKRDATDRYVLLKTYPICRWSGHLGPKKREGDRQAPEGFYFVSAGMMNPRSQYHLSFDLGYPNRLERALGYDGTALMVHGACTSSGCFAMTDDGVSEVYALAREAFAGGQQSFQVQSLPFRMTPENMALHRSNPNMPFWRNLMDGADYFEATKSPPLVFSCERRYVFPSEPPSSPLNPLGACPRFTPDANAAELIATLRANQAGQLASRGPIAKEGSAYVDGGMHTSFRKILQSAGPRRLSEMTSAGVDVSQPDAALKDPFPLTSNVEAARRLGN